jgi:hypothetical protein
LRIQLRHYRSDFLHEFPEYARAAPQLTWTPNKQRNTTRSAG